jgi:hypothetical protein
MPGEKKMAVDNDSSPAKSKTSTLGRSTGNTVAHVTMLDGSVLDVSIEVKHDPLKSKNIPRVLCNCSGKPKEEIYSIKFAKRLI